MATCSRHLDDAHVDSQLEEKDEKGEFAHVERAPSKSLVGTMSWGTCHALKGCPRAKTSSICSSE
jgi:hypothetical protein